MGGKEKRFCKYQGGSKYWEQCRSNYVDARNIFDRTIRRAMRKYNKSMSEEIENSCSNNPRELWDHIQKLGSLRINVILVAVYDDNDNVINDEGFVFGKWTSKFQKVTGRPHLKSSF